jgi:Flp pilus assembly protein TadD
MRLGMPLAIPSGIPRAFALAAACLVLAGCNTTNRTASVSDGTSSGAPALATPGAQAQASVPEETTGSITPHDEDVTLGKQEYRAGNFDAAAKAFNRAAQRHPRDSEAWLGLAASYDRLRQFELADSAYDQAMHIDGQTAEILNNQGYSYLLRGDYARARAKLTAAKAKDPANRFVQNNLQLLAEAQSKTKTAR